MKPHEPSGARLITALVLIGLLCFILPPAAARRVNAARVERARQDLAVIVKSVRHRPLALGMSSPPLTAGPGKRPQALTGSGWHPDSAMPAADLMSSATVREDPWGNSYLVKVGPCAGVDAVGFVISAGANGILETGYETRGRVVIPGADDLIAPLCP